ncbi:MAG: hypothetical protein IKR61_02460 [Lachnospiraceae bacterium]|nr:hypothetical protein [Lachnospiraceae bacterium]
MLNEERIALMTRMASYEAGEGKRNMQIGRFFRGDYVAIQVLKSFVSATISFLMIFAIYVYYNLESFMEELYEIDLLAFARDILTKYAWFVGVYIVIAYIVCTVKYAHSRRNLHAYYNNLKKLGHMYQK